MKKLSLLIVALLAFAIAAPRASEIGHFAPGVPSIRDFTMPDPGFYGVVYNYYYMTDRLNDAGGNKVESISLKPGPGPGVTLNLDVDVNVYALAPTFIWVSPWKILGGRYGAYISPSFGNTSLSASLAVASGSGRSAVTSQFDVGDLFVQPLWLGWAKEHWDLALGYGFYAPTGRYNTETITLPTLGPVTVEAADNIGLGFWTHQIQGAVTWYPWADKRMAVAAALTYEMHEKKDDFDLTPGENLTLNWGVSQYLPLRKDQSMLLELGVTGYSSWQVSDDSGANATNPPVKDDVHAVGAQVGLTYVPGNAVLNFHYLYELESSDRFQGDSIGLNFAIKL